MRGNKDLFPPPSCWTRGVRVRREKRACSLFCFSYFVLSLLENEGNEDEGWGVN
jgi:hypothetical protein